MGYALITGASSGLGEEYAWQLARAGHNLVLVARRQAVLEELADRIRIECGVIVEVLATDLSQFDGVRVVQERLEVEPAIGLLVNNAGYGLGASFVDNSLEDEENGLTVMVRAVMALSYSAARAMRERGRGAILNVSSVASETGAGTYSAHKAWVKAFTEGLALELEGTGVTATCVMPGPVKTSFFENAGITFHNLPDWVWANAPQVVRESLAAVRRGQVLITPHPVAKVAMAAMRLAPRWVTRAVVKHTPHM